VPNVARNVVFFHVYWSSFATIHIFLDEFWNKNQTISFSDEFGRGFPILKPSLSQTTPLGHPAATDFWTPGAAKPGCAQFAES